jgi:hypothetical protein
MSFRKRDNTPKNANRVIESQILRDAADLLLKDDGIGWGKNYIRVRTGQLQSMLLEQGIERKLTSVERVLYKVIQDFKGDGRLSIAERLDPNREGNEDLKSSLDFDRTPTPRDYSFLRAYWEQMLTRRDAEELWDQRTIIAHASILMHLPKQKVREMVKSRGLESPKKRVKTRSIV